MPATPLLDSPEDFDGYTPKNYKDAYCGWTDARTALSNSLNVPAVKVLSYTTVQYAVNYTERLGIRLSPSDHNLALALGGLTEGVTLRQLCGAYMTYANMGKYSEPVFVRKITDKNGNTIYSHNSEKNVAVSEDVAYMITDMLKHTARYGTASKLSALGYDVAAKTGTVDAKNGNSDAWCALYTTQDTLCIWLGNASMKASKMLDGKVSGGSYPTIMGRQILANIYKRGKPDGFKMPSTLVNTAFDAYVMEKDHLLMLANHHTPLSFVKYDIAPKQNSLPVSEYFSVPRISDFEVKVLQDYVSISFNALPFYTYEVHRIQAGSDSVVVDTIKNQSGTVAISDIPDKGIALYKIIPYYVADNGEILGKESLAKGILFSPGG